MYVFIVLFPFVISPCPSFFIYFVYYVCIVFFSWFYIVYVSSLFLSVCISMYVFLYFCRSFFSYV